ncbi:hypothetical protein DZF91_15310 [Actinomadura logoneensis]|uniref:Uncharacterized protein n=1 Tax=Actinomadura logoneensis TaxID=2293572 RepID=A0A372JLR8_9ACTN|nr:hypothetical protein DZF91_15310 [Actinomadura logoneensis]
MRSHTVMPMTTMTLADLTLRYGHDVLDHLERDVAIPVLDGLQAQGDLIVVPFGTATETLEHQPRWTEVPAQGIEVLRGAAGGNPHTLVADPGTCRWTSDLYSRTRMALGVFEATAPVYLMHPEHGGSGIAPGTYVIRRQREGSGSSRRTTLSAASRLVAD